MYQNINQNTVYPERNTKDFHDTMQETFISIYSS